MKKRRTFTQNTLDNPVTRSIIKRQIEDSLAQLQAAAQLQALFGDAAETLTKKAGMLLFSVAYACRDCRIPKEEPDIRIARGMVGALEMLARFPTTLEDHRPAIQSGLDAIERLLPRLHIYAIGNGFLECERRIKTAGIGSEDMAEMFGALP